jgi:hypothetical protein
VSEVEVSSHAARSDGCRSISTSHWTASRILLGQRDKPLPSHSSFAAIGPRLNAVEPPLKEGVDHVPGDTDALLAILENKSDGYHRSGDAARFATCCLAVLNLNFQLPLPE